MRITLETKPERKDVTVAHPSFGDLTLVVRQPTYRDRLDEAMARGGDWLAARVRIVEDWRGVEDADGKPVGFTPERLGKACEQHPELLDCLAVAVAPFWIPLPEDVLPKSGPTRPSGSTERAA